MQKYKIWPADRTVGTKPGTKGGIAPSRPPPFCAWFLRNSSVCRENLIFLHQFSKQLNDVGKIKYMSRLNLKVHKGCYDATPDRKTAERPCWQGKKTKNGFG